MNKEWVFEAWAPENGLWSRWTKPVVFAFMHATPPLPTPQPLLNLSQIPSADGSSALVLDLPGSQGVESGLALAERGYCPVPLYNSAPGTGGEPVYEPTSRTVVEVLPILNALWHGAEALRGLRLSPTAPPAFLLDKERRLGKLPPSPGNFDNRSVCFPTDFPSANMLLAAGIRRVMLVQLASMLPEADLEHTLRRWQDAGVSILTLALEANEAPQPLQVSRPSFFRHLWYRLKLMAGLQRNPLGGFGGLVPVPSSSG